MVKTFFAFRVSFNNCLPASELATNQRIHVGLLLGKRTPFDLFTEPSYFPELKTPRPCVLIGGRGTGKTTVLRGLSYEGQYALSGSSPSRMATWDYFGLYYRVNTNRVSAFTGGGLSDAEWVPVFGHYINLLFCDLILRFLDWHQITTGSTIHFSSTPFRDLAQALHLDVVPDTLRQLGDALVATRVSFEAAINNIADNVRPPLSIQGGPLVVDEYRKTVGEALGGIALLGTLLISVLTLRSNEKGKVTGRFAKAFDHLGAMRSPEEKIASEVRIGGVAELEGVGEDSPREKRMIQSSFAAYVRHYAGWRGAMQNKWSPAVYRLEETQAMLSVLGRWGIPLANRDELSLSGVDLRHLHLLAGSDLSNLVAHKAHFDYATLEGVNLTNTQLSEAHFRGATLRSADFRNAALRGCDFVRRYPAEDRWGYNAVEDRYGWNLPSGDADLTGADLRGADLTNARITEAQFRSAMTDGTTLGPASFLPI